jgi:site-specific DNA recombinase
LDSSTPSGRLVINILGSVAAWERENAVARITDALRHRKESGKVYGVTPLGFDRKGDRLVPNPAEQRVIRRILGERRKGRTLGAIAEGLNQDRVPTKQGGRWWASTVRAILRNDLYARREARS